MQKAVSSLVAVRLKNASKQRLFTETEPLIIEYQGISYILDGHARSIRARQLGSASIEAIILSPSVPIDFGVVKITRGMNLRSLDDVKIVE